MIEYKIGDAVLFAAIPSRQNKFYMKFFTKLQKIFDGKAAHVAYLIGYNPYTGIALCIDALGDDEGGIDYREYDLNENYICVRRRKVEFDQDLAFNTVTEYYNELKESGNLGYSKLGLFDAAINSFMDKLFPKLWKKKNIFKDEKNDFCSEFYGTVDFRVTGLKISRKHEKNIDTDVLTPSDVLESNDFFDIKKFGKG